MDNLYVITFKSSEKHQYPFIKFDDIDYEELVISYYFSSGGNQKTLEFQITYFKNILEKYECEIIWESLAAEIPFDVYEMTEDYNYYYSWNVLWRKHDGKLCSRHLDCLSNPFQMISFYKYMREISQMYKHP